MGLNVVEMSDVIQYIDSLDNKRIHDLLHKMQFEYSQYTDVGTVEDCRNYKILCNIPMSQINRLLQVTNESLIDEIKVLRKEVELLKQNGGKRKMKK